MKKHLVLWRLAYHGCAIASFLLTPVCLLATWLLKLANEGLNRSEIQLLHATAMWRTKNERINGTQR